MAVVGGAGRMGAWFTRYFSSRGFPTVISDVRGEEARSAASAVGAELKETSIGAVRDADLVLICVPIVETPEVISEAAPHMRRGAVLAECPP
ncbi:MAG: prephenate dehydrogenase/arogenate dehydrogenase family protein [Candidatus Bathyarchaeota archaeon]|nr:prephenate dehydrogenase/arogenate dehydrogenase family protein [Candidatus Bathyarchaeota archaeon]